jgi:hypothetical protein
MRALSTATTTAWKGRTPKGYTRLDRLVAT